MKILMDTHTMLWLFNDDERLSEKAKEAIEAPQNSVFVSIVSFWEIAIKMSLNKLNLDVPFERLFEDCETLEIGILNIDKRHLFQLKSLPFEHRDTFDRLIICKAIVDDYTLASADGIFRNYNVKTIW